MNYVKSLIFIFLFILFGLSNSHSDVNSNTINCGGQEMEKNFKNLSQCSYNEILENCFDLDLQPSDPSSLHKTFFYWFEGDADVSSKFNPLVRKEPTRGKAIFSFNGYCGFPEKLFNERYEVIYTYLENKDKTEKIKNSDSLIVSIKNPSEKLSNTIFEYFLEDFDLYDTSPSDNQLSRLISNKENISNIFEDTYPFFWFSRKLSVKDYTVGLYIENRSGGEVRFIEIHYFKDGNFGQQFAKDYDLYIEELIEYNDPNNNQNTGVL